ncbi:MAG: hypothetical protein AAFQ82_18510 [Myxococcota bacterium]
MHVLTLAERLLPPSEKRRHRARVDGKIGHVEGNHPDDNFVKFKRLAESPFKRISFVISGGLDGATPSLSLN